MASLYSKVKKYLENNSKTWDDEKSNIALQDDGSGPYIKTWNVSGLTKPNDTALNNVASDADAAEALYKVLKKRKTEYKSWEEQLDQLWHDIDDDKLDKNGSWYKAIKAVKDNNSKG
mgnify:CR=1 FL=1|jgi:flagellar motility protein MotE (MotC chaperone)